VLLIALLLIAQAAHGAAGWLAAYYPGLSQPSSLPLNHVVAAQRASTACRFILKTRASVRYCRQLCEAVDTSKIIEHNRSLRRTLFHLQLQIVQFPYADYGATISLLKFTSIYFRSCTKALIYCIKIKKQESQLSPRQSWTWVQFSKSNPIHQLYDPIQPNPQ